MNEALPAYAGPDLKARLLALGVSGTVYAMVSPETEAALASVVDGCDRAEKLGDRDALDRARRDGWLGRYLEPWTGRQDAMHDSYFERWLDWAAPVVALDPAAFPFRYPTAGASEAIYKLMAEHAARVRADGGGGVHVFEGEYEGFSAFAAALSLPVVRHARRDWRAAASRVPPGAQFWISQPSAIDGDLWPDFEPFLRLMADEAPDASVFPDLTYVGSVARAYRVALDAPNVPAFVISHSKPFGGYYQRVGGVFARRESPSLFGNRWFKNLQSLAWATEMMDRHDVFALPRRYRPAQEAACARAAESLDLPALRPADVVLLATAPVPADPSPLVASLVRGAGAERRVRVCLTPMMTAMAAPELAPTTVAALAALGGAA